MQVLSSCATCLIRKYECMHAHLYYRSICSKSSALRLGSASSLLFLIPALKLFSEFDSKASLNYYLLKFQENRIKQTNHSEASLLFKSDTEISRKSFQADHSGLLSALQLFSL